MLKRKDMLRASLSGLYQPWSASGELPRGRRNLLPQQPAPSAASSTRGSCSRRRKGAARASRLGEETLNRLRTPSGIAAFERRVRADSYGRVQRRVNGIHELQADGSLHEHLGENLQSIETQTQSEDLQLQQLQEQNEQALEDMAQADLAYLDMVLHKAGMHPTAPVAPRMAQRARNLKRGERISVTTRVVSSSDSRPATPLARRPADDGDGAALAQSWQQLILLALESQKLHLRLQVNTMSPQVLRCAACLHSRSCRDMTHISQRVTLTISSRRPAPPAGDREEEGGAHEGDARDRAQATKQPRQLVPQAAEGEGRISGTPTSSAEGTGENLHLAALMQRMQGSLVGDEGGAGRRSHRVGGRRRRGELRCGCAMRTGRRRRAAVERNGGWGTPGAGCDGGQGSAATIGQAPGSERGRQACGVVASDGHRRRRRRARTRRRAAQGRRRRPARAARRRRPPARRPRQGGGRDARAPARAPPATRARRHARARQAAGAGGGAAARAESVQRKAEAAAARGWSYAEGRAARRYSSTRSSASPSRPASATTATTRRADGSRPPANSRVRRLHLARMFQARCAGAYGFLELRSVQGVPAAACTPTIPRDVREELRIGAGFLLKN